METLFFSFFGNHWDPLDLAPSLDPSESKLIIRAINQLDPRLDAPKSYAFARSFLCDAVPLSVSKSAALVIEKYFIWCFYTAKISPFKARIEDACQFLDFYRYPSPALKRKATFCTRFSRNEDCVVLNPEWRPYKEHLFESRDIGAARCMLNRFFSYIAPRIGYLVYVTKKSISNTASTPPTASKEMLTKLGEKYLDTLENQIGTAVMGISRHRSSHEKKLFLLATCLLLDVSYKNLAKEYEFFNMACFSCNNHNVWLLRIQGATSLLVRYLPDRYLDILFRYRAFLGLNNIPGQDELAPIFKSPYSIIHVLRSLPNFDFMSMSPRLLLKKLAGLSPQNELDKSGLHLPQVHDSSITRGSASALRRTRRVKNTALKILSEIVLNHDVLRCPCPPPPLCFFDSRANQKVEAVDVYSIGVRVIVYIKDVTHADITTLVYFAAFANNTSGRCSRLKTKAYEKLALWCIFVKGISIARLTENDVKQFYAFCVNPPLNWRSNRGESRKFLDTRLFNHLWRPFKFVTEDIVARSQRAGKIIEWCDAVQQELLSRGLLDSNAFRSVSRGWWSLKHH